jgi:release factor glutamine methyltransferase
MYPKSIHDLIEQLSQSGIDRASYEFRLMIAHIKKINYSATWLDWSLTNDEYELLYEMVERRCQQEPLAKILQQKEFYGRNFMTNNHTLDPRPQTEHLIDAVKKYAAQLPNDFFFLDMGCGSGCILVTILMECMKSYGIGIDCCSNALAVASRNVDCYGVNERCLVAASNWFSSLLMEPFYDIIVSNPPYIDHQTSLDPQTLYDPHKALFARYNGLEFYWHLFSKGKKLLKPKAFLIIEIGFGQSEKMLTLAKRYGWNHLDTFNDYQSIPRTMVFKP